MRCPKCKYISFDSTDRCRNCGYEFALSVAPPPLDLPIHTDDDPLGPLADFPIGEAPNADPAVPHEGHAGPPTRNHPADEPPSPPRPRPITSVFDLPLFKDRAPDDDTPLVTPSAVPRQPLSVRRSSPPPRAPRAATAGDEPVLDLDALEPDAPPLRHVPWLPKTDLRPKAHEEALPDDPDDPATAAALWLRIVAAMVDAAILTGLCGAVLYITLAVCGLRFDQAATLPLAPLAGFLLLLVGGYFILLTAAGGQTLGKMAAGIRVASMQDAGRLSLGQAVIRAAGYLVSVLPAGLGLLPAVLHRDRRALHDRLADTHVVKA